MIQVVQRVAGSANYTSSSLDQSLKKANGLYKAHTDVSRRTAQLAQTITHLATTALEEMVHINHTAMAVRTGLRSSLEGRILGLLNFWDSRSAGYTSHWSFAGAWFFFRLMWWLSRTMLSSPLQMLVCFLAFFLRWTYRRLFSPASWKGYPQPVSGPPFIDSRITDSSFRPWTSGPTYSDFRYPGAPSARVHSTNFPWAKQARVWRIPHRSTNWD
ncbi:hypothetical protein OF83DRAFT_311670 [Amylostereum chailletii]|nr:hypothetical protein OF83DRAFT_311670 [Amylostereum chailletii]